MGRVLRKLGQLGLVALLLVSIGASEAKAQKDCAETSTGLSPLDDLGTDLYLGHMGGLYPDGSNVIPEAHLDLGLRHASLVQPRDADGNPDPGGVIGLISIGVSNTRIEFEAFMEMAASEPDLHPRLVIVNGAQGGRALSEWAEGPDANPWFNLDRNLSRRGASPEQVQVAWIMLPDRSRGTVDLEEADLEIEMLASVIRIAKEKYPNLMLAYLSSRIYGGYGGADSEPKAYQHGFTVKWLIERQIQGDPELNADIDSGTVVAPWLAWGPYLWADGTMPRSDGLTWECDDFVDDGIHPGEGAAGKAGELLMQHFSTHVTSAGWFLAAESTSSVTSSTQPTTSTAATTPTTQSPRRSDVDRSPEERQRRAQAPDRAIRSVVGLPFQWGWAIAGVAVGLGVSLTVALAMAVKRETREESDDLELS